MAKEFIVNKTILDIVKRYAMKLKNYYKIDSIILFGSYAKGTNTEDSDIDVAIITNDIKTDVFDEEVNMMCLRKGIDLRLEPHIFRTHDYETADTPIIQEIIDTGIKVA